MTLSSRPLLIVVLRRQASFIGSSSLTVSSSGRSPILDEDVGSSSGTRAKEFLGEALFFKLHFLLIEFFFALFLLTIDSVKRTRNGTRQRQRARNKNRTPWPCEEI